MTEKNVLDTVADLIYTALENPVQIGNRSDLEMWVCALMAAWNAIAIDVKPGRWQRLWREACKSVHATSSQSLADRLNRTEVVDHLREIFNSLRKENRD